MCLCVCVCVTEMLLEVWLEREPVKRRKKQSLRSPETNRVMEVVGMTPLISDSRHGKKSAKFIKQAAERWQARVLYVETNPLRVLV